jgi:hypothetical protein
VSAPGYESWFLSARSPDGRRGLWLRRTVHEGPDGSRSVAAWCTKFEATTSVVKQIWVGEPDARLLASPDRFLGVASDADHQARWDVSVHPSARPLRPMTPRLVYRLPVPRTKVEVPVPAGTLRGHVEVDGRRWEVDGWPATVGHNWGTEHAEQWLWLHALDVDGFEWVELIAARVRVGLVLTPWTATGAAGAGGRPHRLGGLGHPPSVTTIAPGGAALEVRTHRLRLAVTATADPAHTAVVTYRGPRGGTRAVAHSGLADITLSLEDRAGRTTSHAGLCAVEVGSMDGWPGVVPLDLPLEPA